MHTLRVRWAKAAVFSLAILSFLSLALPADAQQASGIAGVVRDTSGLAMPGVTVEAASPVLIEKVRTVTTDGEGRYTIVDLRPGTYTVTFSLEGFSTVKRDGITLASGFTASVNVAMQVGSLSETITVSGAAPVVDTQSMRKQETLNTSELESLPSGNIGLQTLAYVTPGFAATQADVGGTRDTWSAQGNYTFYHGKTGTRASFDGFRNQYFIGAASGVGYITDQGNIQELQLETSGMGAESGSGSTSLNAIPKSGSNTFAGGLDGYFSNGAMQGANIRDNLNDWTLGSAGLAGQRIISAAEVDKIYRLGAQFGGPIMQDKIWFFTAIARWGSTVNQPSAFYNPLQGKANIPGKGVIGPTPTLFYPGQPGSPYAALSYADPSLWGGAEPRKAFSFDWYRNNSGRITAQLTPRNRFNVYADLQKSCRCTTGPFTGANSIESERGWDWFPSGVVQGTWTAPITSRLLLEAGASWQTANWVNFAEEGVTQNDRSILETTTNYRYGATTLLTAPKARTGRSAERFTLSYVTGTHNVKIGVTDEQAFNDESRSRNNVVDGLNYDFTNGRPSRLQYYALPFLQQERQNMELGIFAQDAWKIGRVTTTLGIRYDRVSMGYPEASLPAGLFVPARQVTALKGIPTWNDINPRLGAAWDVFGNGRTAVKASIGRYNQLSRSDLTRRFHPFTSSVNAAFRTWTDSNNNYIPDCDVQNFAAQDLSGSGGDACGAISNQNFGKFIPSSTVFDESVTKDNRDFLWDVNLDFQHEITHGLSLNFSYNHNWDGSFTVTQRLGPDGKPIGPGAYDEFCITVPNDSRLAGSGQQRCGFYDIKPELFGRYTLRVTNAKEFVGQYGNTQLPQRYWDGFTIGLNGRLPLDARLGGGIDVGRNVDDHCFTVDVPNQPMDITGSDGLNTRWNSLNSQGEGACRSVTAWKDTLDFRLNGSVPIKGGFNASFIFRNTVGAQEDAFIQATAANVTFKNGRAASTLTGLGTTLVGGAAQGVTLITQNSLFGARFNQLDLSVNKTLNVGWGRVRVAFDLYNALNGNSIQNVTTQYASAVVNSQVVSSPTANRWLRPTTFLDPRLARVTASIQF
ncbi:MAG TPA: TonB-dependent receptor [Vicinamibacterales bacterium]|nr:TonB-dependent receptor [Vicinamibacterales bacterium]